MTTLTEGSLEVIMRGGQVEEPVMQILGCKKILSGSSEKERYRILLSDGKYFISYAMLTTQINSKVGSGELETNSIIKLKKYITSIINNSGKGDKRVLVILDMETLKPGNQSMKIGTPVQLPEDDSANTSKANGTSNTAPTAKPVLTTPKATPRNADGNTTLLQDQLTNPITSLSPYQNKWVIKARVANKSQIRTWSSSKGEVKLFSIDLIDESGEIRATIFRDLVDKYYDFIEIDKVYYISKCRLKLADKQFSTLKNDYEMTFKNDTIVQECHDHIETIPQTQFDLIPIDKIAHIEPGTLIDIIGVCKSVSDLQVFQAKSTGRELKKKEVTLVDQTNSAIVLTLWGQDAENFDGSSQPVVAIKGAKVSEFGGGKTISTFSNSILKINPDIPESHRLRGWFDNGGMQMDVTNISAKSGASGLQTQWLSFRAVQDQNLGHAERGDYYQVMGTVLLLRSENAVYKACPTEECNKKVIDMENGMYRCEKCNREYPNFKYRLLSSMNVGDWSGNQWISMFSSEAEKVLGMTSNEVGEAIAADPEAMVNIADKTHFKQFIFKCRVKSETYNDEARLKTVAIKVDPVNYKEYNSYLISRIQQLIS